MDKRELRRMFSAQPNKYYDISMLKDQGFDRRKCKKCDGWFWSLGKETCGDTLCEGGYKFIGKQDRGWDFLTAIEKWERFFEKNRHKVVEPYPVVARWRDDLSFVIASIADFQPWVLKGISEPPGNPLAISQPCLRFNDLDNVGRTGRHLSMFFMGGQHAFNLHDYWINETIHFGFTFLNEVLKIKPEEITYKEDVWSGGGNFGPSVESFAGGLEIVNHVFMQFENIDGGHREMDRRVVDTGWGLERIAWYASGKANTYEAIFPSSAKLRQDLKIDVDFSDPLWSKIGLYDVSDGKKLPADIRVKLKELKPLHDLYKVLDHTRALAFALADGAIPSNIGGGYNLRTLLRRVFSIIENNKFDLSPEELIKSHGKYFAKRFKNMKELPDVDDIVGIERNRYYDTKKKGSELIIKYLNRGVLQKKLVELYESHGVPPETAKAIAKEKGKDIHIPENFYLKIDKGDPKRKDVSKGRNLPKTQELYYERPPEESFDAVVLWSSGKECVLDKTQFYPTGGGQIHDTGILYVKKEEFKVVDVYREGTAVIHVLNKDAPHSGAKVLGKINVTRRKDIMRHHTAVHIVNGSALKVLGKHIWQAGSNKTDQKARLDITHYKAIDKKELRQIEKISNEIVLKNMKVRKRELSRAEAEQKFGFRLYQGGVVPGAKLRTINLPGHDAEACGGTHCDYTGEVGTIRLLSTARIQDGVVRIELIAGMRSLERIWEREDLLERAADAAGSKPEDLEKSIEKLKKRIKALKKVTTDIKLEGTRIKWAIVDMPFRQMEELGKRGLRDGVEAVVIISKEGGVSVVSKGKISAVKLAKEISKELGADAGGTDKVARGGAKDVSKAKAVLKKISEKY
ncbi:MAG: alanine--tRNA ligase [Candidatus Altiarchaeota archaeon]|nr:alanine--tRNA ligase [Candidatus Altiarchaeota archaeon]